MLDNSLGQHCRDIQGQTKLVKGQKTLSVSSFSGSKCKKSRDDSYESQLDTNGATQEHSSVSEKDARACHAQVLIGEKCKWKMALHQQER